MAANGASLNQFMEEMAFKKIKKLIFEKHHLDCSGYRDEYLKRRFDVRLRATNTATFGRYLVYLNHHPEEFHNLLDDLTVNYTQFFRDQSVYSYLEATLLPKILLSSTQVRIWSAGCATGEEPYSLAILVSKTLGDKAKNFVTIYAADIDEAVLSKAANGVYQKNQVSSLDQQSVEKYFVKEGENFRVNDPVKRLIRFERADLMKPAPHQNLDLILCRNVMIYFSKEAQQRIYMNFYQALKDGGYLVTGKSELLTGEPAQRFVSIDIEARVYQKPVKVNDQVLKTGVLNPAYNLTV